MVFAQVLMEFAENCNVNVKETFPGSTLTVFGTSPNARASPICKEQPEKARKKTFMKLDHQNPVVPIRTIQDPFVAKTRRTSPSRI